MSIKDLRKIKIANITRSKYKLSVLLIKGIRKIKIVNITRSKNNCLYYLIVDNKALVKVDWEINSEK